MIKLGSTVPFPRAFPRWLGHLFRVSRALQWVCSCLTCCTTLTLNRQRSAGPYCQPPCPSDCVCEQPWGMERLDCSLAHISRFERIMQFSSAALFLCWFGTDWITLDGRHDPKTASFQGTEKCVYETMSFSTRLFPSPSSYSRSSTVGPGPMAGRRGRDPDSFRAAVPFPSVSQELLGSEGWHQGASALRRHRSQSGDHMATACSKQSSKP